MKLLKFLTLTSKLHSNITNVTESIQQVYQTMQVVAEIEKFDKFFNDAREAWVGGIADFGDPQAAIQMQQHPQYDAYRESLNRAVAEHLGNPFVAYRLMSKDQIEEWQSGADMPAIAVSTELSIAKAFRKLAANRGRDDLQVVQLSVPADAVIMLGHSREHELVVDANHISAHEIGFLNESIMLTELTDVGGIKNHTSEQLRDELIATGWEAIGDKSFYSTVYGKDSSPWVVKILNHARFLMPMSDGDLSEPANNFVCAMKWYRYCLNNWESNPHLPRIPFVTTLNEAGLGSYTSYDHSYAVLIEKLEPLDLTYPWDGGDDTIVKAAKWAFMSNIGVPSSGEHDASIIADIFRAMPNTDMLWKFWQTYAGGVDREDFERKIVKYDHIYDTIAGEVAGSGPALSMMVNAAYVISLQQGNPLSKAYAQITSMSKEHGCLIDLKKENVMVRPSTGELVITDPVQG